MAADNDRKWRISGSTRRPRSIISSERTLCISIIFSAALLMAAGFSLPTNIPTRGYLTVDKDKMSKSRGTFILVRDYLGKFPADYLRYFLTSVTANNTSDTDFSYKDLADEGE